MIAVPPYTALPVTDPELEHEVITLRQQLEQAHADLEQLQEEFDALQEQHTTLLDVAKTAFGVLETGAVSVLDLLLELRHQYSKTKILEQILREAWHFPYWSRNTATLMRLDAMHNNTASLLKKEMFGQTTPQPTTVICESVV